MRRWIVVVLVIVIAVVAWRVLGSTRRATVPAQPIEPIAVPVEVAPVTTRTLVDTVTAGGTVEAVEDVTVTSKIPGRVAAVYAQEGDAVRAGQVLVRLDSTELATQVQQVEANLQAARARLAMLEQGARPQERAQVEATVAQALANYETAKSNYSRMQALYDTGAISKAQLDAAQLQRDVAEAQYDTTLQQRSVVRAGPRPEELEMARAQVAQVQAAATFARLQVASATITSPLSGTVTRRSIDPGELASPGIPLLAVARIDTVYVTLDLSETDLGKVRSGQSVAVQVGAYPDRVFRGTVREIAQTGDARTRVFKIKVVVENHDHALKPGMFARGEITVGRTEGAMVIPRDAVITDSGQAAVFVAEDGAARQRAIRLGAMYGPVVRVLSGLRPGDSVIVSGQSGLSDGSAVTIR